MEVMTWPIYGDPRVRAVAELAQLEELPWEVARRICPLQETLEPPELPETTASLRCSIPACRS
jgi:hypothetical protein